MDVLILQTWLFLFENVKIIIILESEKMENSGTFLNVCWLLNNTFVLTLFFQYTYRVAVVNKITDFLLFIGIAMVTIGVVVLSFFYFTFSAEYSLTAFVVAEYLPIPNVRYYWVIIIVSPPHA